MDLLLGFTCDGNYRYGTLMLFPQISLVHLPPENGLESRLADYAFSVNIAWIFFIVSFCFGKYK